jgi:hypothetical protein
MQNSLIEADVLELSNGSLTAFEQRIAGIPKDLRGAFAEEARQLEAELLTVYRVVVLCARKEEDLDRVARWWEVMVRVCDAFAERLRRLEEEHPGCGAHAYFDRVLDLRNKCLRLQTMHS